MRVTQLMRREPPAHPSCLGGAAQLAQRSMPTLAALPALAAADEDRAADEHRAAVAWLLLDDRELFLTFDHFPWFKQATVEAILNLDRPAPQHLRWPDLDVDLAVESIEHPERYPLKSKL